MRFGEDFLDEIKARVRVSDVVGKRVKLKRQGREFAGLSPFTNEKTPSFFVNDEKGFYHCFSSGKHGDGISFLMEVEGLSFPEAVEAMANMAGLSMPKADPDAERRAARNKETINWIEAARDFYAQCLRRDIGKEARRYLVGRGLNGDDCARFGIGFAPNSFDALKNELVAKGATPKQLIEAGLLIEPEQQGKEPWDRFRNRIMFSIADPRGRLVAFGGRAMERDAKAKYLNSPETNLFHKGRSLYNYSTARRAVSNPQNPARGLIVAEGYMDVIALAKAGFEHAVAPLGTALTEEQLDLLWRVGPEPILCFDGDKAGVRAAFRGVERALPLLRPGQTLRFALLPDGLDPDDLIREKGAPAMKEVLEKAVPLVDMLWQREVTQERLDTPEAIAGLKQRIFAAVGEIEHSDVKEQYKTALLGRFDKEFGRARYQNKGGSRGGWTKNAPVRRVTASQKASMASVIDTARERRIVGAILEWPELLPHIDEMFFELQLQSDICRRMQKAMLTYWRDTIAVDKRALHAHIETNGLDTELKSFFRGRALTMASFGGTDADLEKRLDIWTAESNALMGQIEDDRADSDVQTRMAEKIRSEDKDALSRLIRASRDDR